MPEMKGILLDATGNATLTKTITVSKKPVEQLGYLKDVNSLVVLSAGESAPPFRGPGIE